MHVTPPKPEQRTAAFAEGVHAELAATPVTLDFLAPAQHSDELGRLGTYRILKVLGKGGMGMVFLAEDTKLERQVALKVMLPRFAEDPAARQRFLREARTAAKIEHDHIVHIYQVDEDRGVPFLAMQLLSGSSLEDVLRRAGRLTVPQVLRLGAQIADGLAVAHAKDLIHRDIKPANIWVEANYGGRVKLLDFGLARTVQTDVGITQSGVIVGTPAYMPPEQARGDKVDHRCDLYALGCVMYRMATGELPFKGKDTMALLMALALNEPMPPKQLNEAIPDPLNDLILKLLAKDVQQRPESAKAVTTALRKIEQGLTSRVGDVSDELAALAMPAAAAPLATAPAMTNPVVKLSEIPTGALAPTITDSGRTNINEAAPTLIAPARRGHKKAAVAGAIALVALIAALLIWRNRDDADGLHGSEGKYALYFGDHGDTVAFTGLPQATPKTITIEARVKITGKGHGYLAGMGGDTGYSLWRGPRQFGFTVFQAGSYVALEFPTEFSDRFVHLAGVWDGTEPVLFIDGQRVQGKVERGKWGGEFQIKEEDLTTPGNLGQMAIGAFDERLFRLEAIVSGLRISKGERYQQDFMPPARFEADDKTFALYRFNEGQGDKLMDSSGNGYHGKIIGAKWMSAAAAPSRPEPILPPTAIKGPYALRFAGKTQVQLPPKVINEKLAALPEFTFEAVVTPESDLPDDIVRIFGSGFQCGMSFRPDLGWHAWINKQAITGSSPWRKGRRVHFAMVRRPKDLRLYVNGQLQGWSALWRSLPTGNGSVTLGGWGKEGFHGLMEAFRVSTVARYDKDFSLPERFVPDAQTLVLYRFDEGEGGKLLDSSGNGHHGTIVGARWVKLDGAGREIALPRVPGRYSLAFRGEESVQVPTFTYDGRSPLTLEVWARCAPGTGKPHGFVVFAHLGAFGLKALQDMTSYYLQAAGRIPRLTASSGVR